MAAQELALQVGVAPACQALGVSRATFYRRQRPTPWHQQPRPTPAVKGGEKPDQRAEQNTATAAFGVRWSEGVGMRPGAVSAGNEGRA